jgi:hypothetical protein
MRKMGLCIFSPAKMITPKPYLAIQTQVRKECNVLNYSKISLLLVVLTAIMAGSARAECPIGDLDDTCRVDVEDLRIFAEQWLDEESVEANLDGVGAINGLDYALLAKDWLVSGTDLVINEIMTSNNSILEDPDESGEYPDWIEIYNAGTETIDMSGMYLTDNLDGPTQWQIPGGITIDSNTYLVFYADDDDEQGDFHTNFRLTSIGEQVGLFHSDGVALVDSVDFEQVEQYTDVSYGLDANDDLRFFGVPTPGAQNNDAYLGLVADTTFSRDRGFYETSFDVEIECDTPGAEIYYTVDFNKPDPIDGTLYTSPISVTETTSIRAMAFKAGWKPTNVDTHTYIFLDNVVAQTTAQAVGREFPDPWYHIQLWQPPSVMDVVPSDYDVNSTLNGTVEDFKAQLKAIPTISIVTEMADMWQWNYGFYVNSWLSGVAWEREASVEYFDANGVEEFHVNCGIRAQGNQNRRPGNTPKHSMRLRFKKDYGPTKLRYALFKDSDVETFDSITLRGGCNDSWHTYSGASRAAYTRDKWGHETMHEMGLVAPYGNFVHLYLNGLYWGVYNPVERPDAPFYAEHMGGDKEDWEANNAGLPIAGQTPADLVVWNTVLGFFPLSMTTISDTDYDLLSEWLDMTAFVDYLLVYFYGASADWGSYNFYAAAKPGPPGQPPEIGLRFSTWDFEESLGLYNNPTIDMTGPDFAGRPDVNICRIYKRLMGNAKFQKLFADRTHKWLFNNSVLTTQKCVERWNGLAALIEDAIIGESARWGDAKSQSGTQSGWQYWIGEVVSTWLNPRRDTLLGQLRARDLYPSTDAPIFNIDSSYQHGGYVADGASLTMDNPNGSGTIYYTLDGNDPSDSGIAYTGTSSNITLISEDAAKKVLVPSGPVSNWNELGFSDGGWTHGTPITPGRAGGVGYDLGSGPYDPYCTYDVESEMHTVNPSCYVRVAFTVAGNPGDLNTLTLRMRYDDGFVAYINGTEVARDHFVGTPQWNSAGDWRSDTTAFSDFNITGSIGELVSGSNVLAIQAINDGPSSSDLLCSAELLATTISGGGITLNESTLVKARVLDSSEWSALNEAAYSIGPIADNLRITEMMYHPADAPLGDPNAEFIELKNVGGTALKLNLVKFANGVDFTFPSMTLAAGSYVVVVKDTAVFTAQHPTFSGVIAGEYVGSLANNGERVRLEDAVGGTVLEFRYRDGWRPFTDGQGYSLTVMDENASDPNIWDDKKGWDTSTYIGGSPGEFDNGPRIGSVVINEILAHSNIDPNDWIELHNTTGSAIDITDWYLSDNDSNLMKYKIPSTSIPPNGYVYFTEDDHFGSKFALSENGETAYLTSGLDGNGHLTGYRETEDFGASEAGVSFGRYTKSDSTHNFVSMASPTLGVVNSAPKVGPIVINEIMYHPDIVGGAEFVELYNITGSTVYLYDYDPDVSQNIPWKFTDSSETIDCNMPPDANIPAYGYLLLVRDLVDFEAEYSAPGSIQRVEWPNGKLSNGGEKIQLSRPGDQDAVTDERYYIRVDRVVYSDGFHPVGEDPWPTEPDGQNGDGSSLAAESVAAGFLFLLLRLFPGCCNGKKGPDAGEV